MSILDKKIFYFLFFTPIIFAVSFWLYTSLWSYTFGGIDDNLTFTRFEFKTVPLTTDFIVFQITLYPAGLMMYSVVLLIIHIVLIFIIENTKVRDIWHPQYAFVEGFGGIKIVPHLFLLCLLEVNCLVYCYFFCETRAFILVVMIIIVAEIFYLVLFLRLIFFVLLRIFHNFFIANGSYDVLLRTATLSDNYRKKLKIVYDESQSLDEYVFNSMNNLAQLHDPNQITQQLDDLLISLAMYHDPNDIIKIVDACFVDLPSAIHMIPHPIIYFFELFIIFAICLLVLLATRWYYSKYCGKGNLATAQQNITSLKISQQILAITIVFLFLLSS